MTKTILVVDDEILIAIDIQTQLEGLGHRVLVASKLDEAQDIIAAERLDLAIVDWHLRDQVSEPLVRALRERGIPFILCSGSALDEIADLFPSTPLVFKPFSEKQLVSTVSSVLEPRKGLDG